MSRRKRATVSHDFNRVWHLECRYPDGVLIPGAGDVRPNLSSAVMRGRGALTKRGGHREARSCLKGQLRARAYLP